MKLVISFCLIVGILDCAFRGACYTHFQRYQIHLNRIVHGQLTNAINRINALNNRVYSLQSKVQNVGAGCQSGIVGTAVPWTKKRPNDGETMRVRFPRRFKRTPALTVALTGSDTYKGRNQRQNAQVVSKNAAGFVLRLKTWSSSIVYGAWYSWMACP